MGEITSIYVAIREELKAIREHLSDARIDIAKNSENLEEHMRRTELLEEQLTRFDLHLDKMNSELTKLKAFFMYTGWVLGAVAGITLFLLNLKQLFGRP